MASCLIDNQGTLELTTDTVANCSGFVVLEPQEFSEMQFLTYAFEVPEVAQLQELFVWAFGIVVIPYLAAWAYQTVINFVDDFNYNDSFNNEE